MLIGLRFTNVATAGTVHNTDVAFGGMLANVYVYFLPPTSPQKCVWITSITLGVPGISLVTDNDLVPLVPQPFVADTVTVPDVNPAGHNTVIETSLAPGPFTWLTTAVAGDTVQL